MKSHSSKLSLPYIPEFDGLRGVAVLGVFAFHLGFIDGGYLGVDLFFVLSGFLITTLLIHEKTTSGSISIQRFWIRRVRRLLPALLLFLIVVGILIQIYSEESSYLRIRNDMLATMLYVANWRSIFAEHDYWALFSSSSPLSHTWSLAIEEQFYLFWPIVVVGSFSISKTPLNLLTKIAIYGGFLSVFLLVFIYLSNNDAMSRVYYGTDTRISAILFGAALSVYQARSKSTKIASVVIPRSVVWISIGYLTSSWFLLAGDNPLLYQGGLLLSSVSVVVVILAIIQKRSILLNRVLAFGPLRSVGLISYGLYLWHYPIFIFIEEHYSWLNPYWSLCLKIVLTFIIATASYLFLELPIRNRKWSPRTNALLLLLALTCLSGEYYFVTRNAVILPLQTNFMSINLEKNTDISEQRILIVGDSVAVNLARGISEFSDKTTESLNIFGVTGCGILGNIDVKQNNGRVVLISNCDQIRANWKQKLITFKPSVVIFMYGGPMTDRLINGIWSHPCDSNFNKVYQEKLTSAVELFSSNGVLVVLPTIAYSTISSNVNIAFHQRMDCINEIFRDVSASNKGAIIIELGKFICPSNLCRTEIDGIILREDGLHYSNEGAILIYDWLTNQVNNYFMSDKTLKLN
jgi:peptidoglycan/LPS O-acetylase OafA/YrhL